MSSTVVVLLVIGVQQGLFALLWAVLALMRLSRRATAHWAVATTVVAASIALVALRDVVPAFWGFVVGPVVTFAGFALLRRGVLVFARRPAADLEHAVLGGCLAAALSAALQAGVQWALVAITAVPLAWVLLRTAGAITRHLSGEFGRGPAWVTALPFALVGAVFGLRGLMAVGWPETVGASLHMTTPVNTAILFALLGAGLLLSRGLVGLVFTRVLMRLRHLSEHDALTGLANRRAIERRLSEEAGRLARYGQGFSVLSIDVDHFKQINDRFGHPAGDTVLKSIGHTLASTRRATDVAARTGGEEFWLLMPNTGLSGARLAAERLIEAVRRMKVPGPVGDIGLTVSIGVAVTEGPAEPIDSVLRRLDAALYRAKANGRDRIEVATGARAGD